MSAVRVEQKRAGAFPMRRFWKCRPIAWVGRAARVVPAKTVLRSVTAARCKAPRAYARSCMKVRRNKLRRTCVAAVQPNTVLAGRGSSRPHTRRPRARARHRRCTVRCS